MTRILLTALRNFAKATTYNLCRLAGSCTGDSGGGAYVQRTDSKVFVHDIDIFCICTKDYAKSMEDNTQPKQKKTPLEKK